MMSPHLPQLIMLKKVLSRGQLTDYCLNLSPSSMDQMSKHSAAIKVAGTNIRRQRSPMQDQEAEQAEQAEQAKRRPDTAHQKTERKLHSLSNSSSKTATCKERLESSAFEG